MELLKRYIKEEVPLQAMFDDGFFIYIAEPFLIGDTLYFRDSNFADAGAAVFHALKITSVEGSEWFFDGGSILSITERDPLMDSIPIWKGYMKKQGMTRESIFKDIKIYFPEIN